MGDMIEGIGDEVVLFVGFLAFALTFLTWLSCRQRQQRPHAAPARQQGESHAQQPAPSPPAESGSGESEPVAGTDGLRHRSHVTSPGDLATDEPRTPSSNVPSHQDGGGRGTSDGAAEIGVRLIQAGGAGNAREVRVSPNTTLQYLRR